tara:strand:+ start:1214 stop:1438 length:225 start_codon:yes stop_codon:yes gene_type:complete
MGLFNPKWRRKLDVLTSLATVILASVCLGFYIYCLVTDQYLHSWYLKIGVGIACIGALGGTIAHELDYYKRKKD